MTPVQRPSSSTSRKAKYSSKTTSPCVHPLRELLVEHLDQDVTGDVGRVDGARRAGGAERPLVELAFRVAREDAAPVLELVDVARRLAREDLDRVLVAEVVRALDRVERVRLGLVLGLVPERGVDARPPPRRSGCGSGGASR